MLQAELGMAQGPLPWYLTSLSVALGAVLASGFLAIVGVAAAYWKWKPQLSLEQSVACRWVNDDVFCIAVLVRYVNTSRARNIAVTRISVSLKRLAPLSLEEVDSKSLPDLLPEATHLRERDKSSAPILDPGEPATETFLLPIPREEAERLKAFTVYTFIHEKRNRERGWGTMTYHSIDN